MKAGRCSHEVFTPRVIAAFIVAVMAVGVVTAPRAGADEYEWTRSFGPDGSSLSEFSSATSVAVDRGEEAVYVLDREADALFKFDLEGNPLNFGGSGLNISGNELSGLEISDFFGPRQIAVDSTRHVIYVPNKDNALEDGGTVLQAFQANGEPAPFAAGSDPGTNQISGFAGLRGLAVDSNGDIYTSEVGAAGIVGVNAPGIAIFSPNGELLNSETGIDVTRPGAMAVDEEGRLYLLRAADGFQVGRYVPSEYPVTSSTTYEEQPKFPEVLDPNEARAFSIDPALSRLLIVEDFLEGGTRIARVAIFDQEDSFDGTFGGPGEAGELENPTGIGVDASGEKVFVAHNPDGGLAQIAIFNEKLCICAPEIESESAIKVTSETATLQARINPNNLDTIYWWEYGLGDCEVTECAKVPVDGQGIGSGRKGVVVTNSVAGLHPQTRYHYRVVAENELDVTKGSGRIFTTQGAGLGFALSDSRAWEMVSPINKYSGILVVTGETGIRASVLGERFVYSSLGSIVEEPVSTRLPEPATVLAERNEKGEWASRDLVSPHGTATKLRADTEFNFFTPDLRRAEVEPTDATPLSPQATEQTPYLWTDGTPPLFTPLLTSTNVPPGTEFGPEKGSQSNPVRIEGATPNLHSVMIRSDNVPLVEDAAPRSIYLWNNNELKAVSELPEGEGGGIVGAILGSGLGSVRHAISDDGSRVFWAPTDEYNVNGANLPALYLRDVEGGESVRLDVVQGGSGAGATLPAFNFASADGHVVFFTDSEQLTAGASASGRDLYRCEIGSVGGSLGCAELTDISSPLMESGESAEVFDQVSAGSEDGMRLYFVARGKLTEEPNKAGQMAQAGEPNLYLWEEGGARFIATLSENDFPVWGAAPTRSIGYTRYISAAASPDGRYFSFTSEASLTGYDHRNGSGEVNTEAFVFDAEVNQLTCLSCNPSGAAPVGERLPEQVEYFPPDPSGIWGGRWVAATLPQASQTEPEGRSLYRPRFVLNNGRVFFNAIDPLVPADSNANWDVYQYEPVGIGSCALQTAAAATVRVGDGCVGLVSSGISAGDAGFLDATPSGSDVFFLTRGKLSALDRDIETDVYDARVNGISARPVSSLECSGEECGEGVASPNAVPPASETLRGARSPVHCGKKKRKVRRGGKVVCVQKKHHKKKRAGKNRRIGR
jgi:DNA-binding beta-propeller fold protein YncE